MPEAPEIPKCGICGEPMVDLPRTTDRKSETIFVCATGRPENRPCDGDLYALATRER